MVLESKGCESWKSGRGYVYGNQVRFSPKEDLVKDKVDVTPKIPSLKKMLATIRIFIF
jgi:hypothetical protein